MSLRSQPDVLARLRAANPAAVEPAGGRSELARTALQRILGDPVTTPDTRSHARGLRRNRSSSPKGLVIVLATLLIGGGAAFAATDPLGWWSANPGEAKYGANPALHVRTPTIQEIGCQMQSAGHFHCAAARSGQRYTLIDAIRPPIILTRAKLSAAIAQARAAGSISSSQAARFKADLAAVPDSFFREYRLASRFGTYGGGGDIGNGRTLVPPAGVPEFLVCENGGTALNCQDLNGDAAAPVGAGVYMAKPTADWRSATSKRETLGLPPGISFTPAEYRLLIDMLQNASTSSSSSSGTPGRTEANPPAGQPSHR